MTYLLDVNCLLALVDETHPFHSKVSNWYHSHVALSWSTCPLTENGFVRVISLPSYSYRRLPIADAQQTLIHLCNQPGHQFWPDDLSIRDMNQIPTIPGPKAITDLYLLALAVKHHGKFASLDASIDPTLVPGGMQAFHLVE